MKCQVLTARDQPDRLLILPLENESGEAHQASAPESAGWQTICYVELDGETDALTRLVRRHLHAHGYLFVSLDDLDQVDQLVIAHARRWRKNSFSNPAARSDLHSLMTFTR